MIKKLLNRIFGQNEKPIGKLEYWRKYRFFELIDELKKAHSILLEQEAGRSDSFENPKEFAIAIDEERDNIEFGNQTELYNIWKWFAPTCDWDDMVSSEHQDVANRIFEIANYWHKKEG